MGGKNEFKAAAAHGIHQRQHVAAGDAEAVAAKLHRLRRTAGRNATVLPLSAATGNGVPEVVAKLFAAVAEHRAAEHEGAMPDAFAETP